MDSISLFLFTNENNEIISPSKIYDFTVFYDNQNLVEIGEKWG